MAKQLYKLTEDDIKIIIESTLKRVLKEGSTEAPHLMFWDKLISILGPEVMLQYIWNYLDTDTIKDFIDYAKSMLKADGFEDEEETDDEYEYEDEFED